LYFFCRSAASFNKRGQSENWDAASQLKPSFRCRERYVLKIGLH
jgi:hypothetical protein